MSALDEYQLAKIGRNAVESAGRWLKSAGMRFGICATQPKTALCFGKPQIARIERAIALYSSALAGYAAYFRATSDGHTLLVEVDDGYSLSSYGMWPTLYAQLLSARWSELVRADCGSLSILNYKYIQTRIR